MESKYYQNYIHWKFDCEGENDIITYPIAEGIEIVYMDFNSSTTFSNTKIEGKKIEITWCSKGRIEFAFKNNTYSYLIEGDFWVMSSKLFPVSYSFPHNIFKGISLVISYELLTNQSYRLLDLFSIDLDYIHDILKLDESWYISKSDASLQHLFEELSHAKFNERIEYFKLKAIELLYITCKLNAQNKIENSYYQNLQISKVKKIREYMVSHLYEKYTIKEIVQREHLSLSIFYKIFYQVYGCPPYEYLKKYKMGEAAHRLLNSNNTVSEIALSLGYSNFSKFTVAFKDVYSILPKDYRKIK